MVKYGVKILIKGKPYYLQYETPGTIDPKTHQTIKEPMGYFTNNINEAFKIWDRESAKAVAAGYEGSSVVEIAG